jgi:hypothetical protein
VFHNTPRWTVGPLNTFYAAYIQQAATLEGFSLTKLQSSKAVSAKYYASKIYRSFI